ncbi:MAG: hypothetical protein LIO37_02205 [Clostridiales bacterium]|nr:hypothetical protein [Clostridiales bacterium]
MEKLSSDIVLKQDSWLEEASVEIYRAMDGSAQKELVVTLRLAVPAKEHEFRHKDAFFLTVNRDRDKAKLHVLIYSGELKYFYDNYKDYYYLPTEDVAIHKSVAAYVDKAHRKQATATTAYLRRSGIFLPQPSELYKPSFRREYWDRTTYFEMPEDFCESHEKLSQYAAFVLDCLGLVIK